MTAFCQAPWFIHLDVMAELAFYTITNTHSRLLFLNFVYQQNSIFVCLLFSAGFLLYHGIRMTCSTCRSPRGAFHKNCPDFLGQFSRATGRIGLILFVEYRSIFFRSSHPSSYWQIWEMVFFGGSISTSVEAGQTISRCNAPHAGLTRTL